MQHKQQLIVLFALKIYQIVLLWIVDMEVFIKNLQLLMKVFVLIVGWIYGKNLINAIYADKLIIFCFNCNIRVLINC